MLGSGPTNPDYPMALARVQRMSKDELQELLNDDMKFDDYIKSLDQVRIISGRFKDFDNPLT